MSIDVDIDAQQWSQACRKKEIETGDPSADDGALVETLLCELTIFEVSIRRFVRMSQHSRGDRHKGLNTRVLEHSKRNDEPEGEREMLYGLEFERPRFGAAEVLLSVGLVSHMIVRT